MIKGIDVSGAQGSIEWNKIPSQDISFAICKATEGKTFTDKTFAKNWQGIKDNNLIRGAYHFARSNDPVDEANNFLAAAKDASIDDFLALDMESSNFYGQEFVEWCIAFLETVEEKNGATPVMYTGGPFFSTHSKGAPKDLLDKLLKYPLWLSAYVKNPKIFIPDPWKQVGLTIWQRSGDVAAPGESVLRLNGIKTVVDYNEYDGTIEEFKNFISYLALYK